MYKFKNRSYKNKVIQVISLLAVFSSLGAAQSKVKINPESEIVILNSNFILHWLIFTQKKKN